MSPNKRQLLTAALGSLRPTRYVGRWATARGGGFDGSGCNRAVVVRRIRTESIVEDGFIGVDVACAKGKYLPVVLVSWRDGRCVPRALRALPFYPPRGAGNVACLDPATVQAFALEARRYIEAVARAERVTIRRIAIDAPSAPCSPHRERRESEQALDAAGISCFATPTVAQFEAIRVKVRSHLTAGGSEATLPHANQLWMLAGFALFDELRNVAPCDEVFPQATVRALASGQRHKFQAGAVVEQLQAASAYTGWPREVSPAELGPICHGALHDQLDAYLSAWVAALSPEDRTVFGSTPDDAIWVPRLGASREPSPLAELAPVGVTRSRRNDTATVPVAAGTRLCPACGTFPFRRWPWGWDAHAAHTCPGLTETEPAARKAEFRTRFARWFSS